MDLKGGGANNTCCTTSKEVKQHKDKAVSKADVK